MPGTGRLLTITLASFALTAIAGIAPADAKKPKNIKDITLSPIVTFDSGSGEGGAEIVAFDSVNDLVLVDRPRPPAEVSPVEDRLEAIGIRLSQAGQRFFPGDLAQKDVSPADLAAVGLQLDRTGAE